LFAGTTREGDIRRSVIAFDIESAIPAGSTVTAVSLTLSRSIARRPKSGYTRYRSPGNKGSLMLLEMKGRERRLTPLTAM
jgi:hypothetical protein